MRRNQPAVLRQLGDGESGLEAAIAWSKECGTDVPLRYRNDAVIVGAGGLLPTPLLQKIGIQFDTKFGTA